MQHPMLPGAWGEQLHKTNTRISTRARRNLGLNALRLRGGMGATQAPISSCRLCEKVHKTIETHTPSEHLERCVRLCCYAEALRFGRGNQSAIWAAKPI